MTSINPLDSGLVRIHYKSEAKEPVSIEIDSEIDISIGSTVTAAELEAQLSQLGIRTIDLERLKTISDDPDWFDKVFDEDELIVLDNYLEETLIKDREFILFSIQGNGKIFKNLDKSLKKDRNFVLEAVKQNGLVLEYAEAFKKDSEIVLAAIQQNGRALEFADESLQKNREIVLAALESDINAFEYADDSLKEDQAFVTGLIKDFGGAILEHADSLKKSRDFIFRMVKEYESEDASVFEYADGTLKGDRDFVLVLLKKVGVVVLERADKRLMIDREIILKTAKKDPRKALKFADKILLSDRGFILALIKITGAASLLKINAESEFDVILYPIEYDLGDDREIIWSAVKEDGLALQYASESLQEDRNIVMTAVKQNGLALEHAAESLKKDRGIVLAAVKQDGDALEHVPESLKIDREISLAAVKQEGTALQFLLTEEDISKYRGPHVTYKYANTSDREIVLAAVQQNGLALEDAGDPLRSDRKIVYAAIKQNPRALAYVSEALMKDKNFNLVAAKLVHSIVGNSRNQGFVYVRRFILEKLFSAMASAKLSPNAEEVNSLFAEFDNEGEFYIKLANEGLLKDKNLLEIAKQFFIDNKYNEEDNIRKLADTPSDNPLSQLAKGLLKSINEQRIIAPVFVKKLVWKERVCDGCEPEDKNDYVFTLTLGLLVLPEKTDYVKLFIIDPRTGKSWEQNCSDKGDSECPVEIGLNDFRIFIKKNNKTVKAYVEYYDQDDNPISRSKTFTIVNPNAK